MPLAPLAPSLESLELFISVVDLGSVSKAAEVHGISQPSASARLIELEKLTQTQLLLRTSHGSSVTKDGIEIYKHAKRTIESAQELMRCARELSQHYEGRMRISASYSIAEYLLPKWLEKMQLQYENVVPELSVANSSRVVENVRNESGLGFVESDEIPSDLESMVIGHDELWVVVSPSHPYAAARSITPRQLSKGPLIMREKGSGTRECLEKSLGRVGIHSVVAKAELGSTSAIKEAVAASSALAVLSNYAVASEVERGTLAMVRVDGIDLRRSLYAIWSNQSGIGHLERTLLRVVTGK